MIEHLCIRGSATGDKLGACALMVVGLVGMAGAIRVLAYVGRPVDPMFPERGRGPRLAGGVVGFVAAAFLVIAMSVSLAQTCAS